MNNKHGSIWTKWDLHVHTPESIAATGYRASAEGDVWESYLTDLEALPPEFKVIGINDYLFIDGYRRILKEKKDNGRLQNIELILPVIELRIDKFGGTNSDLSRVNLHIIFSDEIPAEIIQQHFLNAIYRNYILTPHQYGIQKQWNALATRDSLTELGRMIIESAPPEERHKYSSPMIEGFNNLNFNFDVIKEALQSHYFENKYYTAVGKTEWANIKWNDQSIADKKTIINSADIVFISAESITSFYKSKNSLSVSKVNDTLLDCSDAHHFSSTQEKDRIGKCFTWIKSDCTFKGLRLALLEPDERIFVGEKPEKLKTIENNKTRYIKSIEIIKKQEAPITDDWFTGTKIDLNPGLVAIIGNKGSGKSALADIIALLGNAKSSPYAFLNDMKFRDKKNNFAKHFNAKTIWESGMVKERNLNDEIAMNEIELVKYIPQQYLENICNEIGSDEGHEFDKELKKVIYSHVSEANRMNCDSLDSLISYKTSETNKTISILKSKLIDINRRIALLEQESTSEKLISFKNLLSQKQNELNEHEKLKPIEVIMPNNEPEISQEVAATSHEIAQKGDLRESINTRVRECQERQKTLNIIILTIQRIQQKLLNFQKSYEDFKADLSIELDSIGINVNTVINLSIDNTNVMEFLKSIQTEKLDIDILLDSTNPSSLVCQRLALEKELLELQEKLDEPNRLYHKYLKEIEDWQVRKNQIIGTKDQVDSLEYFICKVNDIENLIPRMLTELRLQVFRITESIFDEISKLKEEYIELYKPVQNFIENNVIVKDKFKLKFEVSIVPRGFSDRFFDIISNGNKGTFYGVKEGSAKLGNIINSYNFNSKEQTVNFVNDILENLNKDNREGRGELNSIVSQLRKGIALEELYNYVFSLDYIRPKYELKLGTRELSKLSPGEKGMLLLMFYLLIDLSDIPLIIDQPEENLDNESIVGLLVPCIKAAKKIRQIIMVTHNPNLAVVCDAEQVVCATISRETLTKITYTSGSIEDIIINEKIVDVLEGTPSAFNNRDQKYYCTNH